MLLRHNLGLHTAWKCALNIPILYKIIRRQLPVMRQHFKKQVSHSKVEGITESLDNLSNFLFIQSEFYTHLKLAVVMQE